MANDSSYIFFHLPGEDNHGFLCQMHPSPFVHPGAHPTHVFNCAEQYMMYRKALVFGGCHDGLPPERHTLIPAFRDLPEKVLREQDPAQQKYLLSSAKPGKKQLKAWERIKSEVVLDGSFCKFRQNSELKAMLLRTSLKQLVEAAPNDRIWGIGFSAEHAEANEHLWGENRLGEALMTVRRELLHEYVEQMKRKDSFDFVNRLP